MKPLLAAIVLLAPAFALAQEPPIAPPPVVPEAPAPAPAPPDGSAPCAEPESPAELYGKAHLERAIRAELEGRTDDAHQEAQSGLVASPNGRYAQATHDLLERLAQRPASGTSSSARAELAVAATIEGLAATGLVAAQADADAKGTTALLMLGAGGGLALSLATTTGGVRPATPALLELGGMYGTSSVLLVAGLADAHGDFELPVAAGMLGGSALALGTGHLLHVTSGQAGAATTGYFLGAGIPLAVVALANGKDDRLYEATALAGSTAGMIFGAAVNPSLRWSRARWVLIGLGSGVGALFGGGVAVLTDLHSQQGVAVLLLAGGLAGGAVTAVVTGGLSPDEAPEGTGQAIVERTASGRWALNSPAGALRLVPTRNAQGRPMLAPALSLLGGSF